MGILKGQLWISLGAMMVCAVMVLAQEQSANTPRQPKFPVGVWESEQTDGSAVGIDLDEVTEGVRNERDQAGDPQQAKAVLVVGAFQRKHLRIVCGEENFFVIGRRDPNHDVDDSSYVNGRLQIRYYDHVLGSVIELHLVLDSIGDVWKGHFRREALYGRFPRQSFDGEVELHRTSPQSDPVHGGCRKGGQSMIASPIWTH